GGGGSQIEVEKTFQSSGGSVMYDGAVFAGGGEGRSIEVARFLGEAFQHCKPIGLIREAPELLRDARVDIDRRVVVGAGKTGKNFVAAFIFAMKGPRIYEREPPTV